MNRILHELNETSTINFKDPIWFREQFKIIMREWAQLLTMRQLAMVMFIYDRTAAWGKEWELIKYSSFVTGITNADESITYAAGMCGSVVTAKRIMSELVVMSIVRKKQTMGGCLWSLNYEWEPNNYSKCSKMISSKISKTIPSKGSNLIPHKYMNIKGNVSQKKLSRRLAARAPSSSIEEALERGRSKAKAARERQELRKKGKLNSMDIGKVWTAAMREAPWMAVDDLKSGKLYLVKREAQALASYSDRFMKAYPYEVFKDYMTWVLHNWPGIMSEAFGWMTKYPPPETPNAFFFIKRASTFEEKYLQRVAFEKRLNMTPEDREVSKLVKAGMNVDQAKAKVKGVPIYGRYVAGGREIKHPVDKTISIKPKTRSITARKLKRDNITLPSLKGNHADDYEA